MTILVTIHDFSPGFAPRDFRDLGLPAPARGRRRSRGPTSAWGRCYASRRVATDKSVSCKKGFQPVGQRGPWLRTGSLIQWLCRLYPFPGMIPYPFLVIFAGLTHTNHHYPCLAVCSLLTLSPKKPPYSTTVLLVVVGLFTRIHHDQHPWLGTPFSPLWQQVVVSNNQ